MSHTIFSMILVLAAPSEDPRVLIERLGGPRYAEREEAAESLRKLGVKAMPALRTAKGHKDAEVRLRAATLLKKIESSLLVEGTFVVLDYENVTVPDLLKSLSERSGIQVVLRNTDTDRFWDDHRVTLKHPQPTPFWDALERISKGASLVQVGAFHQGGFHGDDMVSLGRVQGGPPVRPVWISGPYRITLGSVVLLRTMQLGARRPAAKKPSVDAKMPRYDTVVGEQLTVSLEIVGEPRLTIQNRSSPKFSVALDEFGRSLSPRNEGNVASYSSSSGVLGTTSSIQFQADLARPDGKTTRIASLKGTWPLSVLTKRPDPLEIPLGGSKGKTFESEEASVTVEDVKFDELTKRGSIGLLIRDRSPQNHAQDNPQGIPVGFLSPRSPIQQQVELIDGKNRPIPWYPSSSQVAGESRFTLTINPAGEPRLPEKLRYYSLIRGDTEAAFEFTDVPLPIDVLTK